MCSAKTNALRPPKSIGDPSSTQADTVHRKATIELRIGRVTALMQPLEPRQTIGAQDVMVERRAESVCKRLYLVSARVVQKFRT